MFRTTVCLGMVMWAGLIGAQEAKPACVAEQGKEALADSVLTPFWKTSRMDGETVLFQSGSPARLLFRPTRVLKVTSANGKTVFEEGRDYRLRDGALELVAGSRIPSKTREEMHPALTKENALSEAVGGKTSLLFERWGSMFQGLQAAVTYEHADGWGGYVPGPAGGLARTRERLKAGRGMKMVVLGDSISYGSGSSSEYRAAPCQPPYAVVVADGLERRYGGPVTLVNLSVGGKTAEWGVEMASKAAAEKPDLMVIAFGMNDASGHRTAEAYASDVKAIMAAVKAGSPETEFLLVATMSGNPEWSKASPELYTDYLAALKKMEGPGAAVADMTSLSRAMLEKKSFDDWTANGVNHPNDFGHRVYAEEILEEVKGRE